MLRRMLSRTLRAGEDTSGRFSLAHGTYEYMHLYEIGGWVG